MGRSRYRIYNDHSKLGAGVKVLLVSVYEMWIARFYFCQQVRPLASYENVKIYHFSIIAIRTENRLSIYIEIYL